jgi:2'-5' RNA ligase
MGTGRDSAGGQTSNAVTRGKVPPRKITARGRGLDACGGRAERRGTGDRLQVTAGNDTDPAGRLFIGVPLTDEARREIAARLRDALPNGLPGRAVPVANWHLTLRFLGATRADQLATLREHLRAAELGAPVNVRFGGMGAFSRPRSARVLWIAVTEGVQRLQELARIAEDAARAAGFPPERKSWKPHLTVSRLQPPRDVTRVIERVPPFDVGMRVGEVVVFRSHLGGGPARYEAVERFALG